MLGRRSAASRDDLLASLPLRGTLLPVHFKVALTNRQEGAAHAVARRLVLVHGMTERDGTDVAELGVESCADRTRCFGGDANLVSTRL